MKEKGEGWPLTEPAPCTPKSSGIQNTRLAFDNSTDASITAPLEKRQKVRRSADWSHDIKSRRRISAELDRLCGVEHSPGVVLIYAQSLEAVFHLICAGEVDLYLNAGLTLGMAERVAAGRRLRPGREVA